MILLVTRAQVARLMEDYTILHYLIENRSNATLQEVLTTLGNHVDITSLISIFENNLLMICAQAGNIQGFEMLMPLFGDAESMLNFHNALGYNICLQAMVQRNL